MSTRRAEQFTTIRTEGGLLPAGLLSRVAAGDATLPGLTPDAYHLAAGERYGEVINRAWLRLVGAWTGFRDALAKLSDTDLAQGMTRERWLLILFSELGYGRLQPAQTIEADGQPFPISHEWGSSPIHLVGARVPLDRRSAGVPGAARSSPHSLIQELLNRDPNRLWGFVSNGLRLRLLRDNLSLTRQAYIEIDLQAMMDGEVYSDFVVLWLLAHQSRVEAARPEDCWLERWSVEARIQGTRALDHLRDGVEASIVALGNGFLAHPANGRLRATLQNGQLQPRDYYRQLLRIVYRLLFLLVAEERDLLLLPDADTETRRRYAEYYSTGRLRELAERRRGTRHTDLWEQFQLVVGFLGSADGCPALGLPALGSFLFSDTATAALNGCAITNTDLLTALRALSGREDQRAGYRQRFDYRNLGVEELGSVYESLLELHPEVNVPAARFSLTIGGSERRATGSHYTSPGILKRVLDFGLQPAITRALTAEQPEAALLDLRVLDPACGSGHFLIAAAHRLARALATVRSGELEATPQEVRYALREVVARCLYGVDLNPMAVELCRVALWLETLEPGKPLSFLDHHIRTGDSLLGVPLRSTVGRNRAAVEARRKTLEDRLGELSAAHRQMTALDADADRLKREMGELKRELAGCTYDSWADAIPDAAFKATAEDDRETARRTTAENRRGRRSKQLRLAPVLTQLPDDLVDLFRRLGEGAENSLGEVTIRAIEFQDAQHRQDYRHLLDLANTWTAAFFWPLEPGAPAAPTQELFATLHANPAALPFGTAACVADLAEGRRFLHFEIAWPEVFTLDRDGFDVVIGNPPYLGGPSISGTLGQKALQFLKSNHPAQTGGRVDLAAYFLRRGFDLVRHGGDLCFITTNSIAEGNTLQAGLIPIVTEWEGELVDTIRSTPWEGEATVSVTVVHLHRGPWNGHRSLDGVAVDSIAPTLQAGSSGTAVTLTANVGTVFKGSNPLGTGFQLRPEDAQRLMESDPRNAEVVRPLYGARDLTSEWEATPRRWIIDFGGRTLEQAESYREPMAIIRTKVKPQREELDDKGEFKVKRKAYRERWWQLAERSARLYQTIAGLGRVIAIPEVSKTMLPLYLPGGAIYFQSLFVFSSNDPALFGLLTSSVHWLWAARPGGASTMRVDPRYHQERCFETLPVPVFGEALREVAGALDQHRLGMMGDRKEGLTGIYNRVVDPTETASDVVQLRTIHVELDLAVLAAYGWDDLELEHGVYRHDRYGDRWLPRPETQQVIEQRLLELNHQRAAEEALHRLPAS